MRRKSLVEKLGISHDLLNLSVWPIVDTSALNEVAAKKYQSRKRAVEMYLLDEATLSEISEVTGIEKKEITRYIERCFMIDQYGQILGFRALIPGLHLKSYEREHLPKMKASNYSGAFDLLLEKFPVLRDWIDDKALAKKRNSNTITYSVKYLHKHFREKCKELGISMSEYPLNTEDQGRRSLERYVKKLKERHFGNEHLYGEVAAMMAKSTGSGTKNYVTNFRPFSRVMFDAHKIDLILTIRYTDPNGNQVKKTLKRIWLLVILEIPTNAVLGHLLCVKPEYSQMDVLQCIQNAIHPHSSMTFTIKGLEYPEEGSFPSISILETQWAVWREFWMDNAKANLAKNVKDKLTQTVGCFINAGPVKSPLRRSVIERFFRILAVNGYHLLPSTTGSNPNDPKRKNAEEKALASEISIEHLEELTEAMLAQYNIEPHSGNSGLSPIKAMRDKIHSGYLPRILPEHRRQELGLLVISQTVTVKGNLSKGKRPYINFEGTQYRNEVLSQHASLIGKKLTIYINIMDVRSVRAFFENGSELGQLRVSGKWVKTPHSLETRRLINKFLRSEKRAFFLASNDYVQALRDHLKSSKKKGDKNWYAHQQRYQQQMDKLTEVASDVDNEEVTEVCETESYQEETVFNNIIVITNEEEGKVEELEYDWEEFFKPISF
ncbi:hypothetical protein FHS18_004190 [Paenibacillus phyllosphaerae]|uniref:Integrase catalytic domain-containing protein n=1 Tax=Paenibacillus phyllosphaerae TaxID=274593 RepID=A0A7W5B0P8_9BACL|nr:hypothetical protein [Paenibacillus phyllosphaerae]MBB3112112.1 hypothetical protein [Paenibacillus phyllosphaerae]